MKLRKPCATVALNLLLLTPRLAWADPGEGALQKLIDLLSGHLAVLIFTLAAIWIGVCIAQGERDHEKIKNYIIGGVIVTSAAWFAQMVMTK